MPKLLHSIYCLIFSSLLCFSCNNGENKKIDPNLSEEEKLLLNEISRYPDSLLLKENLIQYYRDNDNYTKAISIVNNSLLNDSMNARLWDIKATLHYEDDSILNAITSFEKAISIYPNPSYLMSLGTIYANTKNAKALDMADMLMQNQLTKTQKEGLFIKGVYYSNINEKSKAISYFDQCLSIDYTFMFAYREKAIALYDQEKFNDALKVLDKAITLQNIFDEGYYWKGRCFEKLNKPNEAKEEYRTTLIYSPDFIEAKEALTRLGEK